MSNNISNNRRESEKSYPIRGIPTLASIPAVCQYYESQAALVEPHSAARRLLFELSREVQRVAADVSLREEASRARAAHLERVVSQWELNAGARPAAGPAPPTSIVPGAPAEAYGYVESARREVRQLREDVAALARENDALRAQLAARSETGPRAAANATLQRKMHELAQGKPRGSVIY